MAPFRGKKAKTSERGIALIVALMLLLLISAALMGMIMMSNTETNVSANFRDEQTAFFAAKAGIEEVRDRLRSGATNTLTTNTFFTLSPTPLPGANNGVLYITNPGPGETVNPWNTAPDTQGSVHYPDTEICQEVTCTSGVPGASPWYTSTAASTSYAASPQLNWKWVRVMSKTNLSGAGTARVNSVDGATNANRVCWNGANEVVTSAGDCGGNAPVYVLTALAVTSSGSRRMIQFEETLNVNIPIVAALYTRLSSDTGQALNVTGVTDPVCSAASVYGAASGTSTVTTPGSGNVTGSPTGTINNYGWTLGDMSRLIGPLISNSTSITTVPGITHDSSNPPNYSLTNGSLGTMPTVTRNGSQAITAITAPGTPITYATPIVGNLTLGGGSGGINGQGVLIVQGNLTIDVATGFNYYGLIVVTGNVTMISSSNASVMPNINGALIGGGTFSAPIANFGGSISLHQNACAVQSSLSGQFYKTVANREMIY
jgi:Tfp pilus assembly protein PilX